MATPDLPWGYWFGVGPKDDPAGWPVEQVPGGPPFPCPFPQRQKPPTAFLRAASRSFARLASGVRPGRRLGVLFPTEPTGPG